MRPGSLVEEITRVLRAHGFKTMMEAAQSSCFNVVAKRGEKSLIIRAAREVEEVPKEHISELCAISNWIMATPLLVAERSGGEELDDDAIYYKNGIYAVSPGALERTLEGDPPIVEVFPSGCFVYINGELVKKRREELGLSIGELARMVGVSRMTIYSYEKGCKRTTPGIAYRLEHVLGIPIVIPLDPLRKQDERRQAVPCDSMRPPRRGLLGLVARLLRKLKLMIMALFCAPFEMMARHGDVKLVINVVQKYDYDGAKIRSAKAFTEVMELGHLVVRPEEYECPEGVLSIAVGDLKNMRRPEDLVRLLV